MSDVFCFTSFLFRLGEKGPGTKDAEMGSGEILTNRMKDRAKKRQERTNKRGNIEAEAKKNKNLAAAYEAKEVECHFAAPFSFCPLERIACIILAASLTAKRYRLKICFVFCFTIY